jgi:hypothetical protein
VVTIAQFDPDLPVFLFFFHPPFLVLGKLRVGLDKNGFDSLIASKSDVQSWELGA